MTTSGFERLLNLISSRLLDGYEAYVSSEIINDVLNCTIRLIKNEDVFKIVYSYQGSERVLEVVERPSEPFIFFTKILVQVCISFTDIQLLGNLP